MRSADVRTSTQRLAVVRVVMLACLVGLAARATHLAVFDPKGAARGAAQTERTLTLAAVRGQIVDRRGQALAVSVDAPSVFAIPDQIQNLERTARSLSPLLKLAPQALRSRLRPGARFRFVERWLDEARAERILALKLPGIGVIREPRRRYPNASLAAQALGFTNIDGRGVRGIELQEDAWLRGTPRRLPVERDGSGHFLLTSGSGGGTAGGDVKLALDATLQAAAERELQAAVEATGARGGLLLSMDPRSGEILALAESPASDPNRFRELGDSAFKSAAFLDATEPGSVMKAFLMAAALDAEAVMSDSIFDCESGKYRIPRTQKDIEDANPYGELDMASVLRVSSNICAVKIAEVLGARAHFETLRRFGFGRKTGSGFPAESAGILNPWQQWGPVERATIAYGQGISVTAVQVAAAASALANGGELLEPRLVLGHRIHGGRWHPTHRRVVRRVIGREQARQVLRMLESVVGPEGTGRRAAIPGIRVAGKTGTAQKWDAEEGRYSNRRFRSWFVGIAPVDAPRLVVVSSLDEPKRPHHTGGGITASLFAEVARSQLASLGVRARPDERAQHVVAHKAPSTPAARPLTPRAAPATSVAGLQGDPAPANCPSARGLLVDSLGSRVLVPNLKTLCAREVIQITRKAGLRVEVTGRGQVIDQKPPAGLPVDSGTSIWVKLGPSPSSGKTQS